MSFLSSSPVTVLPGVGPARAQRLGRLGLDTLGDLLTWYPREYQDRTRISTILHAPVGQPVCIAAMVAAQPRVSHIRKGLEIARVKAVDDTGVLELTFFNQAYLRNSLLVGRTYIFFGQVQGEGSRRQMTNPVFEEEGACRTTGRIVPVYALTEGISNKLMGDMIARVLQAGVTLTDPVPADVCARYHLPDLQTACRWAHFPESPEQIQRARQRIAFQEMFLLSIGLCRLKGRRDNAPGLLCSRGDMGDFWKTLPFAPTDAQRRAAEDCRRDMSGGTPMNRLVQGDVGCGKTAVAAAAVWLAAQNGFQSALMAPTEILAEQHYRTLSGMLEASGLRVALLTGSAGARARRDLNERLALGMVDLVIGTHALLSEWVNIPQLGLVITDEQHRFGVNQRATLTAKGQHPHVLVMSATPIPRTLALIVYGDLDVSIINQLPPGRQQVETLRVHTDKRQRMYGFVRKQAELGHQTYIVCPAVEEAAGELSGDTPELQSVVEYTAHLKREIFPDLRVEYVHGKMKPRIKEQVMADFARGEIQILVSTTVIEVGVDVPNATLMIVENAERFGLSQLHQLRGRVGRGKDKSWCILVSDTRGEIARTRLKTMCDTTDGFVIAEQDLKLRGPGDFFGARQHGLPQLKMLDLSGDTRVIDHAQQAARQVLEQDFALTLPQHQNIRQLVQGMFRASPDIFN